MTLMFQYSNNEEGTLLVESRKMGHQSPRTRQNTNEWVEDEVECMPAEEKINLHHWNIYLQMEKAIGSPLL